LLMENAVIVSDCPKKFKKFEKTAKNYQYLIPKLHSKFLFDHLIPTNLTSNTAVEDINCFIYRPDKWIKTHCLRVRSN